MMILPLFTTLLDAATTKDCQILLVLATTASLLVGAIIVWSTSLRQRQEQKKVPPRVATAWPFIGSAVEFGANCRAFLTKYFAKLETPIFTARIAGKDYHFVDTSYADFSPERLFRASFLDFRPMANDALQYGFGLSEHLVTKGNGPDGRSEEVNAIYYHHMMKPEGLTELLTKAQDRLEDIVFSDEKLYPASSSTSSTKPLHWLIRESLFRATIGSVISESIVADKEDAAANLQNFCNFDEKFPLLLAKIPPWMFPSASKGRQVLVQNCQGPNFYKGVSRMLEDRCEAARRHGISAEHEIAQHVMVLIWAASANTIPTGFWMIYNLLKHKSTAYQAIQDEVSTLYRQRKAADDSPLTVSELDQLQGLDSALTETLRIYSESMIARDVTEDFELDLKIPGNGADKHRYFLKKNSRVAVMMSCLHMDESVFSNANAFQWDRFLADPVTGKAPVFTKNGRVLATPVRAFGGGVSMCPGRKFASYEIKSFVAHLLHRYELELVDDHKELKIDPSRAGLGINVPLDDVDVRITKRNVG